MSNPAVVTHSKLSFSGRARWRACPISVQMSAGMPDKSSPAAAEGTAAHAVAEFYVRQFFDLPGGAPSPADAPDMPVPEGVDLKGATAAEWNAELRRYGREYCAFIAALIPEGADAFVAVEQRVSIPTISPDLLGTADCLIWLPGLLQLIVVDYKYGYGEVDVGTPVTPNPQLAAYAIGALDGRTLQADGGVRLAIYQPRRTFGQVAQSLLLPATWVAEERQKLESEVAAVVNPPSPQPGDHCRYCKGKSKCPATYNAVSAAIQAHCGATDLLAIPDDDLIAIFAAKTAFKAFWGDVEERIDQLARGGHRLLAITERQGRQMWNDPKEAALTLLAIGRTDLLQPVALSEAIGHLPAEWHDTLIARAKPSRAIKLIDKIAPSAIADTFNKYAKKT